MTDSTLRLSKKAREKRAESKESVNHRETQKTSGKRPEKQSSPERKGQPVQTDVKKAYRPFKVEYRAQSENSPIKNPHYPEWTRLTECKTKEEAGLFINAKKTTGHKLNQFFDFRIVDQEGKEIQQ